jgi:hypothetical protein
MRGNELNPVSSGSRGTADWLASTTGIRFGASPTITEETKFAVSFGADPVQDDSWGEAQARAALGEVSAGGALYTFDEVFG